MTSSQMNTQFGTKWFTFYTKVRPWLACFTLIYVLFDFAMYTTVYLSYWWTILHLVFAVVQPILSIIVFVKSSGDYPALVRFIKGVLIFEIFAFSFSSTMNQYLSGNNFDILYLLFEFFLVLIIGYFVWYRLNMKYFNKRIVYISDSPVEPSPNPIVHETPQILFCRKCGAKLSEGSNFCNKCGTEVIKE